MTHLPNGDDDRVVLDGVEWRKMGDVTVELNGLAYQRKAACIIPSIAREVHGAGFLENDDACRSHAQHYRSHQPAY